MYLMLYNSNFYFIFSKQKQISKTPIIFKFTAKCFEFLLIDIYTFIAKFNSEPNIDDNMKIEFSKFLNCLDLYLDQQIDIADINKSNISIYGSITLENGAIIRVTSSFHGKPWFSNISIRMNSDELFDYTSDQEICYGQVIVN